MDMNIGWLKNNIYKSVEIGEDRKMGILFVNN